MCHILIADDDPTVRQVLERIVQRLPREKTVTAVDNGADALAVLQTVRTDLLITDDLMPGITGHELITLVRARGLSLPIILLSGHDAVFREVADTKQVRGVLKPFTLAELVVAVSDYLPPEG
jgi:CheY-like chemotaxis protein